MINYTEKQLNENYNTFIENLKKHFSGERLEKLLHMYSMDELGPYLRVAPASSRLHFHSAYIGGYMDHVMRVMRNSLKIMDVYLEEAEDEGFTKEELLFAALHHDLGKLGDGEKPQYIPLPQPEGTKTFQYNRELHNMTVPHRAVWLLNQYGIQFSQMEMLGIFLADGLYDEGTKSYWFGDGPKSGLPYIVHWADCMSSKQELRQYEQTLK